MSDRAVRESITDVLQIPRDEVTPDSVLTDDLVAFSIDFVDLMVRLVSWFTVKLHSGNPLDPGRSLRRLDNRDVFVLHEGRAR